MRPLKLSLLTAALTLGSVVQGHSIEINWVIDSSDPFFTPQRLSVLEMVEDQFRNLAIDSPDFTTPPGGTWNLTYNDPTTGSAVSTPGSVTAGTLMIFIGAQTLGGSTLGTGGSVGYNYSGALTQEWVDTLNSFNTAAAYKPYAGVITLANNVTWYDGLADTVTPGQNDLFSVLTHELLHVLGIGLSIAEAWEAHTSSGFFQGDAVNALLPGGIALTEDHSHFDSASNTLLMNPSLTTGQRRYMSDLEYAVLLDMGYIAIPEPMSTGMVLLGAGLLFAATRRKIAA